MTIDLTTALPPSPAELDEALRTTLAQLASHEHFGRAIRKNRIAGTLRDRETGAAWLSPRLAPAIDADRLIVTNGTQSALMLLLHAFVGRGGLLVAEALTYVVLKTIASRLGVRVAGVALDSEGVIPDALDDVCRRLQPRALYVNPTVHNPTAAVMSERRRLEIIAVARRHGVTVIEDDVLGAVHPEAPRPIAALAPDITWYVMSLSKCFAMGLRMAYLVAPTASVAHDLVEPVRRLSWWFPNSLSAEIVSRWVLEGGGRRIAAAVRAEAMARQSIAREALDMARVRTAPGALHLWLRLPDATSPTQFAGEVEREGALVRPAHLFSVDGAPASNHVRISLTGPDTREALRRGLGIVAARLDAIEGAGLHAARG